MRTHRTKPVIVLAFLVAVVGAGCRTAPGVMFDPDGALHQWPPPPDEPRIRYVGSLRSADDLKPAQSSGESIARFLFGTERAAGFVNPLGVCTDGADRVFVVDSGARLLHVYDLSARRHAQWSPPEKQGHFLQPTAVASDPVGGRVLVSDAALGVIMAFDNEGHFVGTLGEGVLQRPCGLVVEPVTGRIFVADTGAHQIVVLAPDGAAAARIGSRGQDFGRFNFPTQVALDSQGQLYVSDSLNFRVQVFDRNGEFIRQIGRKGDMPGYFAQPKGIALDPEDHLYVVDANFEAVQVFDTEGTLLMSFGREGHEPGEFWLPVGIFVDHTARVWIADSFNRRIQVFQYLPAGVQP